MSIGHDVEVCEEFENFPKIVNANYNCNVQLITTQSGLPECHKRLPEEFSKIISTAIVCRVTVCFEQ